MMSRLFLQAAGLAFAGAALAALPSPGLAATTAAQSATKACSTQYQAAKAAGTLNGQKWPQFLSDCSARLGNSAAAPATAPVAAPAAGAAAASQPKTRTTATATTSGHQTTQQICSTQYQAAKSAGTLGGQKWPQFLKACRQSIAGDTEDQAAAPAEPGAAPVAAAPAAVPSAGGKALTPGQVAFRQRIHECSVEWQGEKAAGTLPAGSKWPQFWSACNTRLKAQG